MDKFKILESLDFKLLYLENTNDRNVFDLYAQITNAWKKTNSADPMRKYALNGNANNMQAKLAPEKATRLQVKMIKDIQVDATRLTGMSITTAMMTAQNILLLHQYVGIFFNYADPSLPR